ncbi:MAG: hypothetical protein E6J42_02560 [Chloroflexi bacterium]|nr:MAG: hypothetical protein E6J42_02560 [Chloroflexota bacterium]
MNTSKQVNVMVGLLMLGAVATLLYFLWDNVRAEDATDRQVTANAERGGVIFAVQCRSCHGMTGKSVQENPKLPGAILNIESNRLTDTGKLKTQQDRLGDTIHCGRVGTLMPSWSDAQGGPLNDFQIQQLVTMITGSFPGEDVSDNPDAVSEAGWDKAIEQANVADEYTPAKHLDGNISATDTTLVLDNPRGLHIDGLLRIDEDPTRSDPKSTYEVVKIVDTPAGTILNAKAATSDTDLTVQEAAIFKAGDVITVDDETMQVTGAPSLTKLQEDISKDATTLTVADATGLAANDSVKVDAEKMKITGISGNTLTVQRATEETTAAPHTAGATVTETGNIIQVRRAQMGTPAAEHDVKVGVFEVGNKVEVERGSAGTKATAHPKGTELFNGPIAPGTTITGASGTPPCGQKQAQTPSASGTAAAAITLTGSEEITMGDNFFSLNGQNNPILGVAAGSSLKIKLKNNGSAIHDMRLAGKDGEFDTSDDVVSVPPAIPGGAEGTIAIAFDTAGTSKYRCDFHPADMNGEITVQ